MKKILIALLIFLLSSGQTWAGEFSLRPGSGQIKNGEKFTVDVLIDSEGDNIVLSRVVLTYDPKLVKVVKAEKNDSLFCTYPGNDQSVDNTNGVVMLTGFCQSGVGTPYKTGVQPDVFARIQFEALSEGTLVLDWEYSGSDESFKSVLMKDGSPTVNALTTKPSGGSYSIVRNLTTKPSIPDTAARVSVWMIAGGILLVGIGIAHRIYAKQSIGKNLKGRTIVVYE